MSLNLPDGVSYGFDFDPVSDRIRIVSGTGLNLRVNPMDGSVVEEGKLNPISPRTTSVAYTNSLFGATSTTLYNLAFVTGDGRSRLYLQNPPSAGTLSEIGSVEVSGAPVPTPPSVSYFDIGGTTNTAYGTAGIGANEYAVVSLDLMTAKATYLRQVQFAGGPFITGLAVAPGF
jgi:hypothetical protein